MDSRGVEIVDVAARDGLQDAPRSLAPSSRHELGRRLLQAGVPRVEIASFVQDSRVPQMAGAERVVASIDHPEDDAWCALVLDERGYDRLLQSGLRRMRLTVAVSDAFSEANAGRSTEQSVAEAERILRRAQADGIRSGVVLATAFGCPFSGSVDPGRVLETAARLIRSPAIDELILADTIGVATPTPVCQLVEAVTRLHDRVGVHLHNTRNAGYANAHAALEAGATILDSSLGGLGGCPFAPGATGNIATEDLVYLLEHEGVATGIDLDAVCAVARWLRDLSHLPLDGQLHRVGDFPPPQTRPEQAGRAPACATPTTTPGPLAGVRVIEVGSLVAGPFAGRLLADMGAEVIKVETPRRPDPLRDWGHGHHRGRTLWWPVQSRNKKCITCDLATPAGRELFLDLARTSDVLLENLRPGTLDRYGVDAGALRIANPQLLICRVSGFGQTGPYASRPGFASVAEAMGGLRHINGVPGETPPRMQISLGDSLGGLFAALGIVMALYRRDVHDPAGQEIDVSLVEACFALTESMAPEFDLLGLVRGPGGTSLEGIVPSNVFETRDGPPLIIAANSDALFARLCVAIDRPEMAEDPRLSTHRGRSENRDEIERAIADWAIARSANDVDEALQHAGVVCGPIYTISDICRDPHFAAREMLIEQHDEELGGFRAPGVVPKMSQTPGSVRWSGPATPGSHNDEIYGDLLGVADSERTRLRAEGVI